MIGAWPGISSFSGFFLIIVGSMLLLIFAIWNIVTSYDDLNVLMYDLVNVVGLMMCPVKLITLRVKRSNLMFVINKMIEDWSDKNVQSKFSVMAYNNARSKLMSKVAIILYNAPFFMYILQTLISYFHDSVEDRKFFIQLAFPGVDVTQIKQSPFYEILFAAEFITSIFCFNIHALTEGLLATSIFHASSKVDIVQQEIVKFSNVCRSNNRNRKPLLVALKRLIQSHEKFIEFSENIQDLFSYIAFVHIFLFTLLQVFSGYMFIDTIEKGENALYLLHYAMLTIVLIASCGYYCIAGEYLTNQSELIFVELYNCFWYEFRLPEQNVIKFMLAKSRIPVCLTFGKFDELSLVHLSKIMKTSFSYLSLVRAVR